MNLALASILAMAIQGAASAAPPSKGTTIPSMPGLIVSVPAESDPEIWIWPSEGIDPAKVNSSDLKLAESVIQSVRGGGVPTAPQEAIAIYLEQKQSESELLGQMKLSSIGAVRDALSKCSYSRSIIISPPKEAGRRTAVSSSFKCGAAGVEDDAFITVVIEAHRINGVFVQPKGAVPVLMVGNNG